MKQYTLSLSIAFLALAVITASLLAFLDFNAYLLNQKQVEKDNAISACLSASTVETSNTQNNTKTTDPIRATYQLCMNDKGYPTSLDNK